MRPVDHLPFAQNAFGMTRPEAHRLGCCIRCKRDVSPGDMKPEDAREYEFSAICPACWDALFPEDTCE